MSLCHHPPAGISFHRGTPAPSGVWPSVSHLQTTQVRSPLCSFRNCSIIHSMLEKAAVLLRAEQGRLILLTFTWSCSLSLRGEPGLRPGECAPHAPALGSLAEERLPTSPPMRGAPPVAERRGGMAGPRELEGSSLLPKVLSRWARRCQPTSCACPYPTRHAQSGSCGLQSKPGGCLG